MNEDIWEVLQTFEQAILVLEHRIDSMDQEINDCRAQSKQVEDMLFDDIINPAKDAIASTEKDMRFDDFNSKYGEQLGSYNDKLKVIENNPDFDLTQTAFDEYDTLEDVDSDQFVNDLVASIDEQLNQFRDALGAAPDSTVEVIQEGEGEEPEVLVDGQPVEDAAVETDDAIGKDDEPVEEEAEDEIVDELPNEGPTDEELADLEKEAEAAMKKAGKLPGRG